MKAAIMTSLPVVRCDEHDCGWKEEIQSLNGIGLWLHKECPKCGKGEIISDEDFAAVSLVLGLLEMEIRPEDAVDNPKMVELDTAIFREKEK